MMKNARQTALEILIKTEKNGAYSTLSLRQTLQNSDASDRDRALVTLLVYGVIEKKITLDHVLAQYLTRPLRQLSPALLCIMRLGVYQLLFAEKIPSNAAVNESVMLAKNNGCAYAAGMVNAVLRKVAASGLSLPSREDPVHFLSVAYSAPETLVSHWISCYGQSAAEQILSVSVGARPVFIRVNTLKTNADALIGTLEAEGIPVCKTAVPDCLRIFAPGDLAASAAFQNGAFYVQDMSSQLCAAIVGAQPGETVLDCCAAPGGKTFTLAQFMRNTGRLIACDQYRHKTRLIEDGAKRLGIDIAETVCMNALHLREKYSDVDRALCDVPCSGLGVIGRKPELKYRPLADYSTLPDLQYTILSACAETVRPGGTVVYSTCTLNPAENDAVCDRFLASNPSFSVSDDAVYRERSTGRYITILPSEDGGDGFFIARFERNLSE